MAKRKLSTGSCIRPNCFCSVSQLRSKVSVNSTAFWTAQQIYGGGRALGFCRGQAQFHQPWIGILSAKRKKKWKMTVILVNSRTLVKKSLICKCENMECGNVFSLNILIFKCCLGNASFTKAVLQLTVVNTVSCVVNTQLTVLTTLSCKQKSSIEKRFLTV